MSLNIEKFDNLFWDIPKFHVVKKLDEIEKELDCCFLCDRDDILEHGLGAPRFKINEIIAVLLLLEIKIKALPSSKQKKSLQQKLRIFSMFLRNRLGDIASQKKAADLAGALDKIDMSIGTVPKLNKRVYMYSADFLPVHKPRTIEKWERRSWGEGQVDISKRVNLSRKKRPIRDSCETEEGSRRNKKTKKRQTISQAREFLLDRQNDCIECKVEGEALCYSSVDFFPLKELQVDHAQPSSNLIYRQSELIKAMNFDNLYGMSLLLSPENYGYFILDKNLDGIVPTKKFYMDYHNYYENLWLITNGTNSAADKGCKDFVDWLANHDGYGDDFFASIGGVESIDRSAIIFTTSDGMLLCDAAKSWFREKNKEEIIKVGFMTNEVTSIMIDRNSASTQEEKAFNVVSFTAMSHMAKNRNLIFGSENGSLNKASEDYLHDSDGEFTDENIEIARNVIRSFNEEISDVYTKVKNKYIELRRLN